VAWQLEAGIQNYKIYNIIDLAFNRILSEIFHTCEPVVEESKLVSWIVDGFANLAMVDYPYKNSFLIPVPGWPINVSLKLHLVNTLT